MSFEVITHKAPPGARLVKFSVDSPLKQSLEEYESLKSLNRFSTTFFCGTQGQGKSTQMYRLLRVFRGIFHKVYTVIPASSRRSVENSPLNDLPDDRHYETLDIANLQQLFSRTEASAENEESTLIIFDDVQTQLKDYNISLLLQQMSANQRHLRLCMWILVQNVYSIPKPLRELANTIILFKPAKLQGEKLFNDFFQMRYNEYIALVTALFQEKA